MSRVEAQAVARSTVESKEDAEFLLPRGLLKLSICFRKCAPEIVVPDLQVTNLGNKIIRSRVFDQKAICNTSEFFSRTS